MCFLCPVSLSFVLGELEKVWPLLEEQANRPWEYGRGNKAPRPTLIILSYSAPSLNKAPSPYLSLQVNPSIDICFGEFQEVTLLSTATITQVRSNFK